MNDIIVQQGVGPYRPLMDLGKPLHAAYVARLGMDYEPCAFTIGRAWSDMEHFTLLLSFMSNSGRLIGSIDADALIVGNDDWRDTMRNAEFGAVRNVWGEFNIGVFFIRDTRASIDLLLRCVDEFPSMVSRSGSPMCGQALFNEKLVYSSVKRVDLNRRWNDYESARGSCEGPTQIKAFHSLRTLPEAKLAAMKRYLEVHYAAA